MLNDLIFNALRDLGYTGSLGDMLISFYRDNGATTEYEWLQGQTAENEALNDLKTAYLVSKGFSGALNDMMMRALIDGSYFTQPTGLWLLSTGSWDNAGLWDDANTWNDGI